MTFRQELNSWLSPNQPETSPVPDIGSRAPSTGKLQLPSEDGKPTVVAFLRHCGCPFAEKTLKDMRGAAEAHPDVKFVAVSHSDKEATDKWLDDVGGPGKTNVVVDDDKTTYAKFGLGTSGFLHALNPTSFGSMSTLKSDEGIAVRPTESGSRWQTSGAFAIDKDGTITWGGANEQAHEIPDFEAAVKSCSK